MACCPAHEDRNPSLSLRDVLGGQVLVRCHAGCEQARVIGALRASKLWSERLERKERPCIVAEYNYTDEGGDLLYQTIRTKPKGFFQRHPDGKGGWINRKHPRQVLYRLPGVIGTPIVFVVEGEKDADTLWEHGFAGTTMAGGANAKWLPSFTEVLRSKRVVLIPDNDAPGWALMRRIAEALLGRAACVVCFDDHHRAGAKDITEWFDLGHGEVEFMGLLEAAWRTK